MAMTVAQLANLGLTQNQQNKLETFRTLGVQSGADQPPDISGITLSQAKTALNFANDLFNLATLIQRGANYVRDQNLAAAAKAADDAAPAGTL